MSAKPATIPMLTIECYQRNGTWALVARVAPWEDAEACLAKWQRWHPNSKFRFGERAPQWP